MNTLIGLVIVCLFTWLMWRAAIFVVGRTIKHLKRVM